MKIRSSAAAPKTEAGLKQDLASIGRVNDMTVVVHSSLSAIGWVVGGAPSVVRALLHWIGDTGTLVMPAATPHCEDPASWVEPKVPESWLETVREHLPVFDCRTTPTAMGAIPEAFRNWPDTLRSEHPVESVCARGPSASEIVRDHPLEFPEGSGGPFEKLRDLDASVLLLGVGFNRCTALHFAESLVAKRRVGVSRFPLMKAGRREWIEAKTMASDNSVHFPRVGEEFEAGDAVSRGLVGDAPALLFSMRKLVDFAVEYFEREL